MTAVLDALTPAEILDRAADVLEERGWCRNALERNGRVCALAAINVAAYGDPRVCARAVDRSVNSSSAAAACLALEHAVGWPPSWNDVQRDRRNVVRLFRRVARKLHGSS